MALPVYLLDEELERLTTLEKTLSERGEKLRNFIGSQGWLSDNLTFERLLGDFHAVAISVPPTASPMEILRQLQAAYGAQEQTQGQTPQPRIPPLPSIGEFTLEKGLVIFGISAISAMLAQQHLLPPYVFVFIAVGSLCLIFSSQIKSLFASLFKKPEEKEAEAIKTQREEINEMLDKMRSKYVSAHFLVKFQNQTMPDIYRELGLDRAVAERIQYFNETLPHEFGGVIGKIMVACNDAIWSRKQFIQQVLSQVSRPVAPK